MICKKQLSNAMEFIKENNLKRVTVDLHFHYDKDEEFDYTGCHSLYVNVKLNDRESRSFDVANIELYTESECREEQKEVLEEIGKVYTTAVKREYTHR